VLVQAFRTAGDCCFRIQDALRDVDEGARQMRELQEIGISAEDLSTVNNIRQEVVIFTKSFSAVNRTVRAASCSLFTSGAFHSV